MSHETAGNDAGKSGGTPMQTIGLIGVGRIGTEIARLLLAGGDRVLGYARRPPFPVGIDPDHRTRIGWRAEVPRWVLLDHSPILPLRSPSVSRPEYGPVIRRGACTIAGR